MRSFNACAVFVACAVSGSPISAQQLSAVELHDRLVAVMARNRVLPTATDTFVSWTERDPVLYHLATRWSDSITVGMQRNDPVAGTATVRFARGGVSSATIRWSAGEKPQRLVTVEVGGDSGVVTDTVRRSYPRSKGVWAVADYGMDDLLVASLRSLAPGTEHSVSVLRPYGLRWDSLAVRVHVRAGGLLIESVAAPDDTTRFLVADDGTLVHETRSKYPSNERRPLEGTRAFVQYERLRNAAKR